MKTQSANISLAWLRAKVAVICALGVIVLMQVYAMFWPGKAPVSAPQVSQVTAASSRPIANPANNEQSAPQKSRQEDAKKAVPQWKPPKRPERPSFTNTMLDTETYAMIKDDFIRKLDAPYGKLYRQLNLDPGTLQTLRGLLADKELALAEGFGLAVDARKPLSAASLAALRADVDGPIKELLGDAAYATYRDYESTLPARNHADALEERLSYKTEPLTSAQYDAFVSALSALPDPNIRPDTGAWLGNYTAQITKESLDIARGILTPSQFAVYEESYGIATLAGEMIKKYSPTAPPPKKKPANKKKKK